VRKGSMYSIKSQLRIMLLIIKRFKDEALMVRKDSDIDTIKDTMKLIQLLVTSLNGDKILLSLRIKVIGIYFRIWHISYIAHK